MADALPSAAAKPEGNISSRVASLRLPPPPAQAGPSKFAWSVIALLTAAVVYLLLGGEVPGVPKPLARVATDASPTTAATATTTTSTLTVAKSDGPATKGDDKAKIVLQVSGNVIPEQQILVSPQVSGRVIELNFEAGQRVEKGFVLAILDSTEYNADYQRSLATVEAARQRMMEAKQGSRPDEIRQVEAELAETNTQLEQADRTLKRRQDLFKQGITTPQDLDDAQSQAMALQRRVEKLKATLQLAKDGPRSERKLATEAELRQAEAELSRAKWRLDNTTVVAPITGTILTKKAELGNLVNPVAFNGSFSLCEMADLSKLEVELNVDETDIGKVSKYQRCVMRTDAFRDRSYAGYVSRILPIADRAKATIPVRVRLRVPAEEEGQYLRPEMRAEVTFFADRVDADHPWETSGKTEEQATKTSPDTAN